MVTYGVSSPQGELEPPAHGLGLLLPYTPSELRRLIEIYGSPMLEDELLERAYQRWAGVTRTEVTETLQARARGRWRHWGPFPGLLV